MSVLILTQFAMHEVNIIGNTFVKKNYFYNLKIGNLGFLDLKRLLFHSSSSSFILTWLSGPRSITTTSQKIWQRWESNPGPLDM
jgi:hypothetical protein